MCKPHAGSDNTVRLLACHYAYLTNIMSITSVFVQYIIINDMNKLYEKYIKCITKLGNVIASTSYWCMLQ